MSNDAPIDIAATIIADITKSYYLHAGTKTEWVLKSQVQDNNDGTFTMPHWLAKDKGFI